MKNVFIATISSILSAIVVATFSYYFLTDGPQTPNIAVHETIVGIPMEAGKKLLVSADPNFYAELYTIQRFDIRNNGNRIYKDVLVRATEYKNALIQHDGIIESLSGDKHFTMNPGDVITVSAISSGYRLSNGIEPQAKFFVAVGDRPISIQSSQIDEFNIMSPVINFAIEYQFLSYMIMFIGGTIICLLFIAIAFSIVATIWPSLELKLFSNADYSRQLAIVNYLKKANPLRYDAIVKKAEKFQREKLPKVEEPAVAIKAAD
ncbi:hypothetical protein [Mesorhizobium sp. M0047]|uniref:hypothetical protein n=1 Tax=Mesorhizobium sp. M0047 TaxID=2956859 RepID=UPI0033390DD8